MFMNDSRSFRSALGQFATGVAVVTTATAEGWVGLTVNSFASVSLEPPMILWSLRTQSYSHPSFAECEFFAVNVLAESQEDLSRKFAMARPDKFDGVDIEEGVGGIPLLRGASAIFQCRRQANYSGGDHTIFLGQVERFSHDEQLTPLVFCKGGYVRQSANVETTEGLRG